jgi:hypothetical protein
MAYINCPKCGSINRDSDPKCFSCQADLTEVAPPPPPPAPPPPPPGAQASGFGDNAALAERELSSGNADKPRFKDLASRYEARPLPRLDSNLWQGIRSGLIAGLLTGFAFAFYRSKGDDDTWKMLIHYMPALHTRQIADIVIYSLGMNGLFGLFLGGGLGATGRICFTQESTFVGAVLGAVGGALIMYFAPHADYTVVVVGAVNGYLTALLASLIERKIFR